MLRSTINSLDGATLRLVPGGAAVLRVLADLQGWLGEVEGRLAALEAFRLQQDARIEALERAAHWNTAARSGLPATMERRLARVLDVARAEGQLETPISDQARPGGARPGDLVRPGGKGEL